MIRLKKNLRIAKPEATLEEIQNACRMASVHDFIMTLPDSYLSKVGTLGDNLSAGEKTTYRSSPCIPTW